MSDPKGADASLVETIVGKVKAQGLFDQFRRECLADVESLPGFHDLRQLVENTVSKFLSKQEEWTPELNKNHLREKLRRNIIELNFLEKGVEMIVDQVVDPKISTVFQPNIEEMVYRHLGIEQPKVEKLEPPGLSELSLENSAVPPLPEAKATQSPAETDNNSNMSIDDSDLLPTDLEAVSPDSNRSAEEKNNSNATAEDSPVKVEPEEMEVVKEEVHQEEDVDKQSPLYESIGAVEMRPATAPPENCVVKTESQESDISGLTSQDSIESEHDRKETMESKAMEVPLQGGQEALKEELKTGETSAGAPKEDSQLSQVSSDTQGSVKFDQEDQEPLKMDISEEAQMPSRFPEPQRNERNEVLTTFAGLPKEAFTFEQAKREGELTDEPSNEEKLETDTQSQASSSVEVQQGVGTKTPPVDSVCPSGEVNKILVKSTVMEDTEESLLDSGDSMDLKIVESDSRGSVSNSNHSDSKKDDRSRSSSHRSRSNPSHHRSSSSSKGSSNKERSSHRSRDHSQHKTNADKMKGSSRKESSRKQPRDNKDKEKEKGKEKKDGDSCRDRSERRSTDRDSNDGTNSGGQSKGVANGGEKTTTATTTKPSTEGNQSKTTPASPKTATVASADLDPERNDVTDRLPKPIVVDQFLDGKELSLKMRVATPPSPGPLKKPKIAANLKEAMKLSKVRKMMDLQQTKEEERAAVQLNKSLDEDSEEGPLYYFPEEREGAAPTKFGPSVSEKWWKRVKENNEEQELVREVRMFCEAAMKGKRASSSGESKGAPGKKQKMIEAKPTATPIERPINGLRKPPVATTTTTTGNVDDLVDMDDYHEAEVDLDDLSVPLTENNNVQKENKNYGLAFNKLGGLKWIIIMKEMFFLLTFTFPFSKRRL